MMKFLLFFIFILLAALPANAQKIFLSELAQPRMIAVDDNRLYVADRYNIFIYSLKDYKLVKRVGKKGEGPGEFMYKPFIQLIENKLMISSATKISYFSRSGEFIHERKIPGRLQPLAQVGKRFVAKRWEYNTKEKKMTVVVSLYDNQFQELKALYQSPPFKMAGSKSPVKLVAPKVKFICTKNRIYLKTKTGDFRIDVYDYRGERISSIKRDYPRIKVTALHKQKLKEAFWSNPIVRKRIEHHKKREYIFPEYFHAINDFHIADAILYVNTFSIKDGKEEFLLFDLDGNDLRKVYLPAALTDLSGFKNNRFYFINENEEEEEWELHVVDINRR